MSRSDWGWPGSRSSWMERRGQSAATGTPIREYRGTLRRLCDAVSRNPSWLQSAALQEELLFQIPARLLQALAACRGPLRVPSFGARARALQRAIPFIEEHRDQALTVREVCQAAGVSRRTLDYAFRECFGVTPKAYLTALRLDGVRRELVPTDPPLKIADIANRWGFWHMGQLAAGEAVARGGPCGRAGRPEAYIEL